MKLNEKFNNVTLLDDFRVEGHDGPQSLGFTNASQQSQFTRVTQVFHVQFGFDSQLVERKRRFSFPSTEVKNFK